MAKVTIKASANGPYLVVVNGNVHSALCRCGASKNKPFCDGSHQKVGFEAPPHNIEIDV